MTSGYANGSDLLIMIGSKAIGHCTSHSISLSSETKERAVKPASTTAAGSTGLYKEKTVTGLSVSIQCEGLRYWGESEAGVGELLDAWKDGSPVTAKAFARGNDSVPYLTGSFIISSLEESAPAGDDATYSATLENSGAVTIDESKIDGGTTSGGSSM